MTTKFTSTKLPLNRILAHAQWFLKEGYDPCDAAYIIKERWHPLITSGSTNFTDADRALFMELGLFINAAMKLSAVEMHAPDEE